MAKSTTDEASKPSKPSLERILEIALMPLVVAAVGGLATFFITKYQSANAERIAASQLASAERSARSERELKALELFTKMITSTSEKERELAVRLLRAVDDDLATRLARAIVADDAEAPNVRAEAQEVVSTLKSAPAPFFLISQGETPAALYKSVYGRSSVSLQQFMTAFRELNGHVAFPQSPDQRLPMDVLVVLPDPAQPTTRFYWFRCTDIDVLLQRDRFQSPSLAFLLSRLAHKGDDTAHVFFMSADPSDEFIRYMRNGATLTGEAQRVALALPIAEKMRLLHAVRAYLEAVRPGV